MVKAFLTSDIPAHEAQAAVTADSAAESGRESVRILVKGSPRSVKRVIHELYRVGFAEVREWSKPQATGRVNEVIRILTRYVLGE
ncbi:hypothetical protein [Pseudanabaena sp. FACHB-2040]|uniref:hypothetical protein n=1 Tax=Pseudanabaena sp. FACHB-2040 TaxID=2692859 RepID=UPI0016865EC7|nr:hypothetical protein [Pseudanabaena sp. FACHB-2040]MBD2258828.1 hypothetical protein [Pseudanabaena sp. FACHB-2040]